MKKLLISIAAFLGVSSMAMTSCQDQLPQKMQEQWEEKQETIVSAVSTEMKEALKSQMDEFLQSDDLEESLGFTDEQRKEIEQSMEQYIEQYEFDAEALNELTQKMETLFQDAKGLTKEEIQEKLDEMLEK